MTKLSIKEMLHFCTTRIEAQKDEETMSYGTGFFFNMDLGDGSSTIVIITNKHVANDKRKLVFYLSKADEDGSPKFERPIKMSLDETVIDMYKVNHPDPEVDLCCITILPLLKEAEKRNIKLYYQPLSNSMIPDETKLDKLDGYEDVIMVGYPNSLWDDVHNMPLIRKGITATWPRLNFKNKKEFLIDAACYPGSSGSPVMICDTGSYDSREGELMMGKRLMLLGVQYAVPVRTAEGRIKVTTLDELDLKLKAEVQEMLNLGYIIKSECILDLIPEFVKKFPKEQTPHTL